MNAKVGLLALALLLVAGLAGAGQQEWATMDPPPPPEVVVYYLHNHIRCQTCRDMESMAAETVTNDFPAVTDSGLLVMRTIDVQDPGQEHFATEFDVTGPSLVVAEVDSVGQTTRWRKLDRIWELAEAPTEYRAYVRAAINDALAGWPAADQTDSLTAKGTP